jgi:mRNA-binding protein PUF3
MNGLGSRRPVAERRPALPFKPSVVKPADSWSLTQTIWSNPSAPKTNGTTIGLGSRACKIVANEPGQLSLNRDREQKPHSPKSFQELADQSQWARLHDQEAENARLAVGPPSRAAVAPSPNPQPDFPSMGRAQNPYQMPSGFRAHRQGLMSSAPKFASPFEPRIREHSDGGWTDAASVQSVGENSRIDYMQPASAGASRNGSLPPSRSGNEPFSFNGLPKYTSRPGSGVSSNVPTLGSRRSSDEAVSPPGRPADTNGHALVTRGQPSPRYEYGQYGDYPTFDDNIYSDPIQELHQNWRDSSPTNDMLSQSTIDHHGPNQHSVVRHQDYRNMRNDWPNRSNGRPPHHQQPPVYVSHQAFQQVQMLMSQMQYQQQYQQYQQQQQFAQYMPQQSYYPAPMLMPMPVRPQMPMQVPSNRVYDAGVPVQSQLLREFKTGTTRDRRWELKDIYGHVVEFAGDTTGSRFLQGKLETANSDEKAQIFAEIFPNCLPLMRDVFGNYVIQKVFEHGDQKQKAQLADQMKTRVYELSVNMYACRVVQKAFDHILGDQRAQLVSELSKPGLVLACVESLHGNHVIQKAIEVIPLEHIRFIYDELLDRVPKFADHLYGCRIVQRMLEQPDDEIRGKVLTELYGVGPSLITSTYGNYVAQHVMEHGGDAGREWIIGVVAKDIRAYGRHKFASNVVEKCIEFGTEAHRKAILTAVLECDAASKMPGGNREDGLLGFIKCGFGNYVIRKCDASYKHR